MTVVGASGHARVVLSTARAQGYTELRLLDDAPNTWGTMVMGVEVGPLESIDPAFGPAVVAIGKNEVRKLVVERLGGVSWATLVHPFSSVDPSARLGPGTVVFAGAVVQPEVVLGCHCVVNTGACVDHECHCGDYVQVAPGARLAGNVTCGEGVMVGIGASVHQGATLGGWSTLGGGAFLKGSLASGLTAVGIPARPVGG